VTENLLIFGFFTFKKWGDTLFRFPELFLAKKEINKLFENRSCFMILQGEFYMTSTQLTLEMNRYLDSAHQTSERHHVQIGQKHLASINKITVNL